MTFQIGDEVEFTEAFQSPHDAGRQFFVVAPENNGAVKVKVLNTGMFADPIATVRVSTLRKKGTRMTLTYQQIADAADVVSAMHRELEATKLALARAHTAGNGLASALAALLAETNEPWDTADTRPLLKAYQQAQQALKEWP